MRTLSTSSRFLPPLLGWWYLVLLLSWVSSSLALSSESCSDNAECGEEGTCAMGRCAAMECMKRELKAFKSDLDLFSDQASYVDGLLAEAGVTKDQIVEARKETLGDDNAFSQAEPVRKFMNVIRSHSDELGQVADIISSCNNGLVEGMRTNELELSSSSSSSSAASAVAQVVAEETMDVELDAQEEEVGAKPRAVGLIAGYLMAAITNILREIGGAPLPGEDDDEDGSTLEDIFFPEQSTPSVSLQPSVSPSALPSVSPSVYPSAAPSFPVGEKTYIGFHLEGGVVFDSSFSLLIPQDVRTNVPGQLNQYTRACIGVEVGAGVDISVIIVTANLRENGDIQGASVLTEFLESYVGVGFGLGIGVQVEGPSTLNGNDPNYFEVTFGGGVSIALVGVSLCRTSVCDPLG